LQGNELRQKLEERHADYLKKFGEVEGEAMYKDWVEHNTYVSPVFT